MAHIDKYAPGSFCWFELATSDQNAAKSFYGSLFGWGASDMPMGPGDFYTMFKLDGRDTGACYTLKPEMKAAGIPPHWGIYIASASADETAAKASAAGGKIVEAPFDVFDVGRMAVVTDPTGATFCIWEEKRHFGAGINGVPGTFCWADLSTRDVPAASKFYSEVFGWQIAPGENDKSGYLHIKNGDTFIGGMPPAEHMPPGVPPHWMLYFYVSDVAASTAKAVELGGKICMGPMAIEKVGNMSIVTDPQGAGFALFTPLPRE
jgi:predicted enzyme related to lactoylglutathione lyase